MAETTILMQTLKQALKHQGKTYADIAQHLELSEASIKRMFSEKNISLQRLDQICQLMEMEISDLIQLMHETRHTQLTELSLEQEQEIANNIELLLVTLCVLHRWTLPDMIEFFHLSETDCIHYLATLDRLKLIDLLPNNRIKLRVAPNFKWQNRGPIREFFTSYIQKEFFETRFNHQNEKLIVLNGMLSNSAHQVFQRKMQRLAQEFENLSQEDTALPLEERHGATFVAAVRRWDYGLFAPFVKQPAN